MLDGPAEEGRKMQGLMHFGGAAGGSHMLVRECMGCCMLEGPTGGRHTLLRGRRGCCMLDVQAEERTSWCEGAEAAAR